MKQAMQNPMNRIATRFVILVLGVAFMVAGMKWPVPLVAMKIEIVNNVFMWVGLLGVCLGFGAIEVLKIWKGNTGAKP